MNDHGQLGIGSFENAVAPTKVDALAEAKIIAIGAGSGFSIIVTDKGLYAVGGNGYGELGCELDSTNLPIKVNYFDMYNLKESLQKIVCGKRHTCILTSMYYSFV